MKKYSVILFTLFSACPSESLSSIINNDIDSAVPVKDAIEHSHFLNEQ